jgi:hypothetical protein
MTENQSGTASSSRDSNWRIILLRSAGFGGGFAIVGTLLLGGFMWWNSRPKPWSDSAVTAKPAELLMIQTTNELAFRFRYAFTNHTGTEYSLPSAEMGALMRKLPGNSALDKIDRATWDGTIRIPPNQTIAVTFTVPFRFSDYNTSGAEMPDETLSKFAGNRLKDIDGLAFFDYGTKYKVEMPRNWDRPKEEEKK